MKKTYLSAEEIIVGRTYKNAAGNIVKVNSFNKETNFMILYDASAECTIYINFRPNYFVELIR